MRLDDRTKPYAIVAAAVALATAARWVAHPLLEDQLPFITYLVVAIFVARIYSVGPALLGTFLGVAVGIPLFAPGIAADEVVQSDLVRYLVVSAAAIAICELMRRSEERADEQAALLAASIGSALDCIITIDSAGRIVEFNPAAERTFGHRREDVLGKDLAELLIPPALRLPHRQGLARHLHGGGPSNILGRRVELTALRSDGTEFPVELTVTRMEVGRKVLFTAFARDITERQAAREALREKAVELAEAMEKQSQFLAMLSHELRNPMAALRNAVEILEVTGRREGAMRPIVEMVGRQVGHMGRLIDDLLDASRIRSGRIHLHRLRVNLVAAVRDAVEVVRAQCAELEHELEVDLPREDLWLDADPTRVVQVASNLLHNACKFTPRGGRITVAVRRDGEAAELRVRDNGIGIEAAHLDGIFDMFHQLDDSLARTKGGLGIGLSLVKSLVEMHGGSIEARSEGPGRGAEFVVRLPLAPAAANEPDADPAPAAVGRRRILVLDDNHDAAESLQLVLELHGHEAFAVHDGESALAAVARERPEVGLLDIGLPGMNGYEVARRIRAMPGGRDMLLVAITGWGQEEDRRRTREAGFDAHLTKPVAYPALARVLAGRAGRRVTGT